MQPKKKMMIVGSHTITEPDHRVKMMISRLCSEGWHILVGDPQSSRSEERRVGKEC